MARVRGSGPEGNGKIQKIMEKLSSFEHQSISLSRPGQFYNDMKFCGR